MKKVIDDPRLMIRVCDLYYNREASRQEIGAQLGLSRPTVNRLLAYAKQTGVVRIDIPDLDTVQYWDQEQKLKALYGLKEVIVTEAGNSREELFSILGRAAARYLQRMIRDGSIVGVSMGSTIQQIVNCIEAPGVSGTVFVPLIGGMGRLNMELHSNHLTQKLADKYGGEFYPFHMPARVSSPTVRSELLREASTASAVKQMKHIDIAIVGIGCPNEHSVLTATGLFKQEELNSVMQRGAEGDVCLQFFDSSGNPKPYRENRQVIGLPISRLRRVPLSVGAAGGIEKMRAIRSAIKGGFINVLITDASCAQALIETASAENENYHDYTDTENFDENTRENPS